MYASIDQLHDDYRSGQARPSQVIASYLERIDRLNPSLNAFLHVTRDLALEIAAELDQELAGDPHILEQKPLFGVPVAHKDLFSTRNIPTTAASKVLAGYLPQYSATVVDKYQAAGAVLMGKLNCDAWAHGSSGENSDFGPTRNPWNADYVPGGSSSGSAAAVAADLCLVASGTDTGGSIRCPASFSGVTGLKPTYGRVSRYGIIAMASSLDSIGHFTRTARDSARVLSVTAGQDSHDATSLSVPVENYLATLSSVSLKGLRIGLPQEYTATDPEVTQTVQAAVAVLQSLGAETVTVSLPTTHAALAAYYVIQPAEVSSNLARYDGIRFGHDRSTFGDEAKRRIMLGTFTLSAGYYDAYYKTAQRVKNTIKAEFTQVFSQVDILVAPVMPHTAFKIGEKVADPLALYLEDVLTVPVNLAGLPSISLPCGFSTAGLPIGFQIIGPALSESRIFQVADSYQSQTDWHHARPKSL